jgi:hypothetical protein
MARVARAMALATRVVCNKEGKGDKGDGDKGGRRAMATRVMVMAAAITWAKEMATRRAGDK